MTNPVDSLGEGGGSSYYPNQDYLSTGGAPGHLETYTQPPVKKDTYLPPPEKTSQGSFVDSLFKSLFSVVGYILSGPTSCTPNTAPSNPSESDSSDSKKRCIVNDVFGAGRSIASYDTGEPVNVCQSPANFATALAQIYTLTRNEPISAQNSMIERIAKSGRVTLTEFSSLPASTSMDRGELGLPPGVYMEILKQTGRWEEVPYSSDGCIFDYPALTFLNVAQYVRSIQVVVCGEAPGTEEKHHKDSQDIQRRRIISTEEKV